MEGEGREVGILERAKRLGEVRRLETTSRLALEVQDIRGNTSLQNEGPQKVATAV